MYKTRSKISSSIILLMIFCLVLAGCSSNANGDKDSKGGSTGSKDEPVKFTIMANLHTPDVPSDKLEKIIEEKTGVDLSFQWVPDSNYEEKLNAGFATGSLPEAVFLKNQTSLPKFLEAIRDDQFWEVGKYLEDYPNLSKLKEQTLLNTSVDGKIYGLYQGRPLSRQGFLYRKDWAEKLGLGTPETIDDIFEMARAFTEDDPDGNGKKDTFGIADRSDLVYGAFKTIASWYGTPNNWGFNEKGELQPEFMFDEYIETMDFMKKLRDNGYINSDFPVTSTEDQNAFIVNGTAGMRIGGIADIQRVYTDAQQLNPDVKFDVSNKIIGPDGEYGIWSIAGFGNIVLFPKSAVKSEEQLKDILGFFDYLMTPEGANLIFWGIEGEHYELQGGKGLVLDQDIADREVKPYQSIEIGEASTSGRYQGLFTYDVKEKAEQLFIDNEQYLINDPTAALNSPTFAEKGELLKQKITDATYQYILGDIDLKGFKSAVESWEKSGGSDIIKEYNEEYNNLK